MIAEFLDAAGIAEVVWIDDAFAEMPREEAADRIRRHLVVAKERQLAVTGILRLSVVDINRPIGEVTDAVEAVCEDLDHAAVLGIEDGLARLVGAQPETGGRPDLLPEEFAALRTAFGGRLRTFSAGQWTTTGAVQYAGSNQSVLFLIDKEFYREGAGIDGLLFLRDLVARANSYCIVLTYTSTPENQNDYRGRFARAVGIQPHQFSVVGKAQDRRLSVDQRFGAAIFEVYARFLTGQLAHLFGDALAASAVTTVNEIGSESVYDIDHAIFENSIEEGASELDVLVRIFRTRQKPKISELIRTAPVQTALQRVREFRSKTLALRAQLHAPSLDLRSFRRWRFDEVFEDRTTLNLLHSPLACGDLFDVDLGGGRTKRYILLVQPCALTVRGDNGKRSGQVGLLVPISEIEGRARPEDDDEEEIDESPYKFFDVKGVLDSGKIWRVDYRSTMFVPLKVLDLAVFNADGRVKILRDHPEPGVILPPGWRMRFESARRWFPAPKANAEPGRFPSPTKPVSAIGHGAESIDPRVSPTAIVYPLSRTGRVEANLADAIYAAWAVYQTRAAFDHDFAKLEEDEPDGSGDVPPQEAPHAQPADGNPPADAPRQAARPAATDRRPG